MYVAQMAFFARVADKRVGGTYMTLLNTVASPPRDHLHGHAPLTTPAYVLPPAAATGARVSATGQDAAAKPGKSRLGGRAAPVPAAAAAAAPAASASPASTAPQL